MSTKTKAVKKTAAKVHPALRNGGAFLPAGYELPKPESKFVQLEEGQNRLRILTPAAIGWEAWIDGEAQRLPGQENPFDIDQVDEGDYGKKLYHFWSFVVWNFDTKKVMLWQVSQRGILTGLYGLLQTEEWGDPREYNIIVTKTVNKRKTEYKVNGVPPKPLTEEIKKALASSTLTTEALFDERAYDNEPVAATDDGFN